MEDNYDIDEPLLEEHILEANAYNKYKSIILIISILLVLFILTIHIIILSKI
jgi:uncharacterized membrane protein YidH (DUF202 family)